VSNCETGKTNVEEDKRKQKQTENAGKEYKRKSGKH